MNPELIAAIISGVATALGGLVSALAHASPTGIVANALRALLPLVGKRREPPPPPDGVTLRILEASRVLHEQENLAKAHRLGGGLLTFGQFVIGGLLASSFMQQELAKPLIGVLGLMVLASSIIRQHYQPESAAVAARERAVKLKAIIREVEDQIYYREQALAEALSPAELRRMLTEALNEVDVSEARALAKAVQNVSVSKSPKPPSGEAGG